MLASSQPQATQTALLEALGAALTLEASDLLIFSTSQVKVRLYTALARASRA